MSAQSRVEMIENSNVIGSRPVAGDCAERPVDDMVQQATAAAAFLKALAHEGRLLILCYLSSGEKSVTELEQLLGSRQAAVSQQLSRLRLEGLVNCRREGKTIFYSLGDPRAARTIGLMYEMFCSVEGEVATGAA